MRLVLLLAVLLGACSASRPAQDPARFSAATADITTAPDVTPGQTGAPVPSPSPVVAGRSGSQSDAVLRPRAESRAEGVSLRRPEPTDATWLVSGLLAHMGSSPVGRLYLAIPEGPGVRVRLCAVRCLTLTSTDVGPSLAMQRAQRIADVSVYLFERVCGVPASRGLCVATMEGPIG